MALNGSGQISLAGSTTGESIALELTLSATGQISLNDTAVRTLAGIASGEISMPANFWGKSSLIPFSEAVYTTAGTYSFVVPTGVTEICAVCVGGGGGGYGAGTGGGGGGGGALSYSNGIPVTAGETLTVFVGAGGPAGNFSGEDSYIARGATTLLLAQKGFCPTYSGQASAGVGAVRYSGGAGYGTDNAGGGGAAGYSGNGGLGGGGAGQGTGGSGGGGGGAYGGPNATGSGGGVGIIVEGPSGGPPVTSGADGFPGSYGSGILFGGGGRAHGDSASTGPGGGGAVRIIYGGEGKSYPNNSAP